MSRYYCVIPTNDSNKDIERAVFCEEFYQLNLCTNKNEEYHIIISDKAVCVLVQSRVDVKWLWFVDNKEADEHVLKEYGITIAYDEPIEGFFPNSGTGRSINHRVKLLSKLKESTEWKNLVINDDTPAKCLLSKAKDGKHDILITGLSPSTTEKSLISVLCCYNISYVKIEERGIGYASFYKKPDQLHLDRLLENMKNDRIKIDGVRVEVIP